MFELCDLFDLKQFQTLKKKKIFLKFNKKYY